MNITTRRINSFRIYFQITLYKAVLFPEIRSDGARLGSNSWVSLAGAIDARPRG